MEDGDTERPAGGVGSGLPEHNHSALKPPSLEWRPSLSRFLTTICSGAGKRGWAKPTWRRPARLHHVFGHRSFVSLQYEQRVKNEKKFDVWIKRKGIKMLTYLSQRWIGSERLQTLPTFVAINNLTLLHLWRNIQIQTCRPVHLSLLFPMIQYHSDRQWDIMRLTAWQFGPQ